MIWLLHGNLGSTQDWAPLQALLIARGMDSCALDLWQFLRQGPCSLREVGQQIAEYIAQRDMAPVLCGYSLGGRVALYALQAFPSLWAGAIIISAHAGLSKDEAEEKAARCRWDARWADKLVSLPWACFWKEWNAQGVFQREALGESGAVLLPEEKTQNTRAEPLPWEQCAMQEAFRSWSLGTQEDMTIFLQSGELTASCLFVAGAEDAKFAAQAKKMHYACPRSKLTLVPQAGHRVPQTEAVFLSEVMSVFLQGVNPTK